MSSMAAPPNSRSGGTSRPPPPPVSSTGATGQCSKRPAKGRTRPSSIRPRVNRPIRRDRPGSSASSTGARGRHRLGHHRDRIAGHHDGVGQRQQAEIRVLARHVPHPAAERFQLFVQHRPHRGVGAPRRRHRHAHPVAAHHLRQLAGQMRAHRRVQPEPAVAAADQHRHQRPRQMRRSAAPMPPPPRPAAPASPGAARCG